MDDTTDLDLLIHFVKMVEEKVCEEAKRDAPKWKFFNDGQSYTYVPLHLQTFIKALRQVKKDYWERNGQGADRPSFIDAGCGLGSKLIIAQGMGFRVTGIELDDIVLKRAEEMFYIDHLNIQKQDILEHDYSEYDVIYFYRPFHNADKQKEFEKRIHSQMKSGAYLMGFDCEFYPIRDRDRLSKDKFEQLAIETNTFYRRK